MSQGVSSNRPVSDLVEPSVDLVLHHHLVAVPVGAWRSGSAPALGAGDREFESRRPDQVVSQLRLSLMLGHCF